MECYTTKLQMSNTRKKEKILQAAYRLFNDSHHVQKVSVEEIARSAGVSPTTIYNYFGTREKLVTEVAKQLVIDYRDRSTALLKSDIPFPDKLRALVSGKLAAASATSDEVIRKIVNQDSDAAKFVDDLLITEFMPVWHDFVTEGKAKGYIKPDLDEAAFSVYVEVIRAGFAARQDLLQSFKDNLPLVKGILNLFFFGFVAKEIDLFPGTEAR